MTQQYLVGEFSSLVAELEPADGELGRAVTGLRHEIEVSPLYALSELAREALTLTDLMCWAALQEGDAVDFARCATTGAALREFTANANLMP